MKVVVMTQMTAQQNQRVMRMEVIYKLLLQLLKQLPFQQNITKKKLLEKEIIVVQVVEWNWKA